MSYKKLALDAFNEYKKIVKVNEKSDKMFGSKLKITDFRVKVNYDNITSFFKPQNKTLEFTEEYAKQTFYRFKMFKILELLKNYINYLCTPETMFYGSSSKLSNNLEQKLMAEKYVHAIENIEKVYHNKNDHAGFDEAVYDFVEKMHRNIYVEEYENQQGEKQSKITNIVSLNENNKKFVSEMIVYTAGGRYLVEQTDNIEKVSSK